MVSQKIRFDVFKRDNFTCQYCGRKSPEVILEVDHITPRAEGGTDDMGNLITSCRECNRGKYTLELIPQRPESEYKIEHHKLTNLLTNFEGDKHELYKRILTSKDELRKLYTKDFDLAAKILEVEIQQMNLELDYLTEVSIQTDPKYEGKSLDDVQISIIDSIQEKEILKQEYLTKNLTELKLRLYSNRTEKEMWLMLP